MIPTMIIVGSIMAAFSGDSRSAEFAGLSLMIIGYLVGVLG